VVKIMLSPRKAKLLYALVDLYNKTGEPVASKYLLDALGERVSSATVRHEMAQLTEMGYLEQPHTSAGRVPAWSGYKYYVSQTMPGEVLTEEEYRRLTESFYAQIGTPDTWLENTAKILAALSGCVVLGLSNAGGTARIRTVQCAELSPYLLLMILYSTVGLQKSRVVPLPHPLTDDQLTLFCRLTQEELDGLPLRDVTPGRMQKLAVQANDPDLMPLLMGLCEMAQSFLRRSLMAGERTRGQEIQQRLETADAAGKIPLPQPEDDLRVILGGEIDEGDPLLRQCCLLVSPLFMLAGDLRMDYAKVLPRVKTITQTLRATLDLMVENTGSS
jgi:heat-inducible transcriptional repressor